MPLTYEINTRCWLRELSERAGQTITLATVPESEFEEWARFGFTHIWLMGVWTSGPRSRALAREVAALQMSPVTGPWEPTIDSSPYAIAEYRVADALGGEIALSCFRQKLNRLGMKLLLDFVPNHVGIDHSWLIRRADLFVTSEVAYPGFFAQQTVAGLRWVAHGRDPHFAPWTDTAQLDYRRPETRDAMLRQLLSVAERCDGVRCDMAMLILNEVFARTWGAASVVNESSKAEFWAGAIPEVKRLYPGFVFIAEVYWGLEARLQELGFDFTYYKELYDDLVGRDPSAVRERLLRVAPEFLSASVHFLENHDEARIASRFSAGAHCAAAVWLLTLPGMRLLHQGQLEGATARLPVQWTCRAPEPVCSKTRLFYELLLTQLRQTSVGSGRFEFLRSVAVAGDDLSGTNVVSIKWQNTARMFDLSVVNLAAEPARCRIPLLTEEPPLSHWSVRRLVESPGAESGILKTEEGGISVELPGQAGWLIRFELSRP